MRAGGANGCPPFLPAFHRHIDPHEWQRVFTAAYHHFADLLEEAEKQLPDDLEPDDPALEEWLDGLPLDPYAAKHPAEFYAVASEAFFVRPQPLAAAYPEVYRLLAQYYRQDPLNPDNVIATRKTTGKHL
jgi:Mlc titration factor MtfA (ptsG expression regulator)